MAPETPHPLERTSETPPHEENRTNRKTSFDNRFALQFNEAINNAKEVLEGKYGKDPSPENARKLKLFEQLFDAQYKRYQNGDIVERNKAITEMNALNEEIWDSLVSRPSRRSLERDNRFDDDEERREVQQLREARAQIRRKIFQNAEVLGKGEFSPEILMSLIINSARPIHDLEQQNPSVENWVKPLAQSEFLGYLRVGLTEKERMQLRKALDWHLKNRPGLNQETKEQIHRLIVDL